MRTTIVAVGSRGDVQPYVALGLGLAAAGFAVTIAAPATFRGFVVERGLAFAPLAGDPQAIVRGEAGQAWLAAGHNPVAFIRRLEPIFAPILSDYFRDLEHACADAELVVYSPLGGPAWSIAEARGIPAIPAWLIPSWPTRAQPSPLAPPLPLPGWLPGTGGYNRLTWALVARLGWQLIGHHVDAWRERALGLPPVGRRGPLPELLAAAQPVLHGFSRHVVPQPRDWPARAAATGYWFLDRPAGWTPPAALVDFLAAGPPPVSIGLGSMADRDPARFTEIALAALRRAGARGVLLSGWAGLGQRDVGDDVYVVDEVPHDWLFPRLAAVVHHGGAGTTAAGLRAGRPAVVLPFFADQHFWGRRVQALGVGPAPIPQRAITSDRLAAAIRRTTTDAELQRRAAVLGSRVRAEDGVRHAVRVVEAWLTRR